MVNVLLQHPREILRRLIKEKNLRKTIGFINFLLSKRIPFLFSPLCLQISLTNRCNLKCLSCSNKHFKGERSDLSYDDFKYIIGQFPFLEHVDTTSFGECFLNKDFFKMLEYLKKKMITVSFANNFTLLDKEIAQRILSAGNITTIVASIDAPDKETFEALRVGAKFEEAIENIKYIVGLRNKHNNKLLHFKVNCTVSSKNVLSMVKMVELTKDLGFEGIFFMPAIRMDVFPGTYLDLLDSIKPEASVFAEEGAKALKRGRELNCDVIVGNVRHPASLCYSQSLLWDKIMIELDGSVWPCCFMNLNYVPSEGKISAFGNIFNESFRSIWLSKRYKDLRLKMARGELTKDCYFKGFCIADGEKALA
ncbi:MAG: radical SAM protein [Candidatus Omnitrophica bacterium]|nr:radical SAM protein [Candidatus Omnitrophota bacterium]